MISLTDDELVVLDGRCEPETQTEVDAAKARIAARRRFTDLPPALAGLVADVVGEATAKGRLVLWNRPLDRCPLCKETKGYVPYKSGPRRGEPNHSKPIRLDGYELADRFVTFKGHVSVGGCVSCVDQALPTIVESLRGVEAEVPERLRADGEPRRVRHHNVHCTKCGWDGHEGQMRRHRTVFGDGTYPSGCPECPAENLPLGRSVVERVDGFTVVTEEDEA